MEEAESAPELQLLALAKSFGAKDTDYLEGVFLAQFEHKDALDHFTVVLDNLDFVDSYELRTAGGEGEVMQYDALVDDSVLVLVYLSEDSIDYGYYEFEPADDAYYGANEDGLELNEVKRRVKVNARGVKRIKMQCNRGFKWDPAAKACVKITGQELAGKRKSNRRAVLTKKSMGSAFKKRVIRKTKKAMRYRSALGLK